VSEQLIRSRVPSSTISTGSRLKKLHRPLEPGPS
jgi:hypothetical protein